MSIIMLIGNCRVSKILVDGRSSINILYGGPLYRMEDILETAWVMISPQTQSYLYWLDGKETCSQGIISLPVRADPCNIITKFYVVDVESSTTQYSGDLGST